MEVLHAKDAGGRDADRLRVGVAQIAPVWLARDATLARVLTAARQAADAGCQLVAFGEALVPGYPVWIERTDGARFNDPQQKQIFARYLDEGVVIERGHLAPLCTLAAEQRMAIYLGVMERAPDRGGHSLYCSLVYIAADGSIGSVHRKLRPTYEERLAWAAGDGHGLRVHELGAFAVGGLNCYENWLPLARAALYAQGVSLHVSVWPGGAHNTCDVPQFIAREGRCYVLAASGLLRPSDVPDDVPMHDAIIGDGSALCNGGSTIIAPDGAVIAGPVVDQEALLVADIDHAMVRGERQNLDPSGHYARPDVLHLQVNRRRQATAHFDDEDEPSL